MDREHSCGWVRVQEHKRWDKTREEKRSVDRMGREDSRDWVKVQESKGWEKKEKRREGWRV